MIRADIRRWFHLALRRRDRWEREVEDEIKLHLALRAEQLMAGGATPDNAYREAVRRFGPLTKSRARLLDAARHREERMHRMELLSMLRQDLAFAVRTLSRQKGWTAITVLTLAIGIGATTAVFSVVSSLLIHAVTYPDADRVMIVEQQPTTGNNTGIRVSITPASPIVTAWRAGSRSFETLEPYRSSTVSLKTGAAPEQLSATWMLPSFVQFAGQKPVIGRLFAAPSNGTDGRIAMISEATWQTRYGGDRRVLGTTITLDDSIYTIVGVLPAALRLPFVGRTAPDVWLPLDLRNRKLGLRVVGRLRPGVAGADAARELDTLARRSGVYPDGKLPFTARVVAPSRMVSFHDSLIALTAAAVALVLLVACANVAHLMLARTAARQRELAVRVALGSGRGRLFRQLLTESLVLALTGAAGGVLLGWIGLKTLVALRPPALVELSVASLDATTLVASLVVASLCGIVFGAVGAVQASRQPAHEALKAGALATSASRANDRLRSMLVISEMALSATLIVGATLLIRSVVNLQRADVGFEPKGLYAIGLQLPEKRFATPAARSAFTDALIARLRAEPGVQDVAIAAVGPGGRNFSIGTLEIEGEPVPTSDASSFIDVNAVANGFFRVMQIPIVQGATFSDTTEQSTQVIVNAGFAHAHWRAGGALGRRIRIAYQGKGTWMTIVGIAGDAATSGPGTESSAPIIYSPASDLSYPTIMVRATRAGTLASRARAVVAELHPQMTPPTFDSIETTVANSIAGPRFTTLLLTMFTVIAILLAAIGLYGVMAYSVMQRTREIGIRMALGATNAAIARTVMIHGARLAIAGSIAGLAGAYWGTRLLVKLLYGVTPLDIASFTTGVVVLMVVAVVACVVPTRRALGVDPVRAIRAD